MQLEEQIKQGESQPLQILIVEDSATFRVLHESYLHGAGYNTQIVGSGEEALQVLDVGVVDIILMDVLMPGLSGFETAKIIRETFPDKWIPILFITGSQKDEDYKEAIASGGDDYIVKPVREAALVTKIQAMANILSMQRGLYLAHEELAQKNKIDVLTSTLSRRYLLDESETSWRLMRRMGHSLAVVMVDVDNFKKYNDHYGHAEGDECLKRVAEVLRNSFTRETDLVGRLGGEEFLVVLPDTDTVEATKLAENCRKQLEALAIPHQLSERGVVTVSMGCTACHKTTRYEFSELVRHADELLYKAKSGGRNCVVWDDFPTSQQLLTGQQDTPEDNASDSKKTQLPLRWFAVASVVIISIIGGRLVVGDNAIGPNKYEDVQTVLEEQGIEPMASEIDEPLLANLPSADPVDDKTTVFIEQNPVIVLATGSNAAAPEETVDIAPEEPAASTILLPEAEVDFTSVQSSRVLLAKNTAAVKERIFAWRDGWVGKSASYFDHYHSGFIASNGQTLDDWRVKRLPKILKPEFIEVKIETLVIDQAADGEFSAEFIQHYRSNTWQDKGVKTLVFRQDGGEWKIYRESFELL